MTKLDGALLRKISRALKAARDVGYGTGTGESMPLQFLEGQLTLNQSGGRLYPPHKTKLPPDFQTFRHNYLLSHGYRS